MKEKPPHTGEVPVEHRVRRRGPYAGSVVTTGFSVLRLTGASVVIRRHGPESDGAAARSFTSGDPGTTGTCADFAPILDTPPTGAPSVLVGRKVLTIGVYRGIIPGNGKSP